MTEPLRPDPDALLAAVRKVDRPPGRGRLTIFFGMAPGVGKTYAMLAAARREFAAGSNVLIGYIETHGRAETAALAASLPQLPRRRSAHRDTWIEEFDLEEALARHPSLIVVDELAHTNAPGSRHAKRHQDVQELLQAGIDVYTTLNVQHVASRADTVRQITGAPIHETVPDSVIEEADAIQLVDLTPDQLRSRLAEGKVYLGDRATVAAENFFKETNLTALRELALRLTAERVDQQLRHIRTESGTSAIWRSGERLLVAAGPSPFSGRLIRWTRRMAYALDAPWLAVSVETGQPLSEEDQRALDENLGLARALGAEVEVVAGRDIAEALVRAAHRHNVSQIVIGKPRSSPLMALLRGGTLVDRLLRRSGQIDLYVVPAEPRTGRSRWLNWRSATTSRPREYGFAGLAVAAATLGGLMLAPYAGYLSAALLYLTAVILMGLFIGQGPILFAAGIAALAWNFIFIPPVLTFRITKFEDGLMFGIFFVAALITGRLMSRIRMQEELERSREQRSSALYHLSRDLAAARTAGEIVRRASARLQELSGARVAFLLGNGPKDLVIHPGASFEPDERDRSVAAWALQHRHAAGRFTDTLPGAEAFHVPLVAGERTFGVLALRPPDRTNFPHALRELIETCAGQIALALERDTLLAVEESARVAAESEKLHRALLDSVSHELKTPLAVISGSAEALRQTGNGSSLVLEIDQAARRLQRLVNNLLDATRVDAGAIRARMDWCDAGDILRAALAATRDIRHQHPTHVDLPAGTPLIRADSGLLEQAVVNLLHNAATHTPPGTPIDVSLRWEREAGRVAIVVADRGPVFSGDPGALSGRFARGHPERPGGLGLGLSIVKGFIEAQGGTLAAEAPESGGLRFTLFLPWEKPASVPPE